MSNIEKLQSKKATKILKATDLMTELKKLLLRDLCHNQDIKPEIFYTITSVELIMQELKCDYYA